jgi:hypothetical protein
MQTAVPRPLLPTNTRIVLRSFNGTFQAPNDCTAGNDYWLLIGQSGTVIEYSAALGRQLVRFDVAVTSYGLHCHNPVPNSLYLLDADLEPINQ